LRLLLLPETTFFPWIRRTVNTFAQKLAQDLLQVDASEQKKVFYKQ